jgi:pyruvate/2-oxoacid:ferredoxin oxidoreductase beta subunit
MKIFTIPEEENMNPGHVACPGCASALSMRLALKALGRETILTVPACCWSVIDGPFPYSAVKVPLFHIAFGTTAAFASGIKAALKMKNKKANVVVWCGDGEAFDIGFQTLSGAAERKENIIFVCYDNEGYMNTGIQRSSATPIKAWTTTTPQKYPKQEFKKDLMEIFAAHKIPYAATATVAFPEDMIRKFSKAKEIKGLKLIHILSPCPSGWKFPENLTIKISRLAVETGIFPLYEIEHGEKYTINHIPKWLPVEDYLKKQGRFSHLTEKDYKEKKASVEKRWLELEEKSKSLEKNPKLSNS